jgi:hypothetical protein
VAGVAYGQEEVFLALPLWALEATAKKLTLYAGNQPIGLILKMASHKLYAGYNICMSLFL